MGMFDEIRIEAPHNQILDEGYRDELYQTKDLDCTLSYYLITADGRLISIYSDDQTDMEYHGDIVFYGWGEAEYYTARFTEGKLQWIRKAEDSE